MTRNYDERVKQMSAYCALQARLLELYDPKYDDESMLREINPAASKAIRKRRWRNLKSLEELSDELRERISEFERQKPETANSQEAKELGELLVQRRKEYEGLCSRNS
jgi:hypothetical protein